MNQDITTVYLIRHSTKFKPNMINEYKVKDDEQLKTEKKMLSVEGEKRAEILSNQKEFDDIDTVYSSNYVRAMQTAKYFVEKNNLKLNIDERFNERKKGNPDYDKYPKFLCDQHLDKLLKAEDGECQLEVNKRMTEAFWEVVNKNRNKKTVIISHGTAISFLLMNWCKLLDVQQDLSRKFEFDSKIVINGKIRAPEVFKILIDKNNNIVDITNLKFEDLN